MDGVLTMCLNYFINVMDHVLFISFAIDNNSNSTYIAARTHKSDVHFLICNDT